MGKRKRRCANRKLPVSDVSPNSSQMDPLSEQKSCKEVESDAMAPAPFSEEISDDSVKALQRLQVDVKPMLLKNSRNCDHKYPLRSLSGSADASTSQGKGNEKIILKLSRKSRSNDSRPQTDIRAQESPEQGTDMSSLLPTNVSSPGLRRISCGLCKFPLRTSFSNIDPSICPSEPSVVAVLVCGHLYHARCLEDKTSEEESFDPPCPVCMNSMP